jgi:hypothetical protein
LTIPVYVQHAAALGASKVLRTSDGPRTTSIQPSRRPRDALARRGSTPGMPSARTRVLGEKTIKDTRHVLDNLRADLLLFG